MAVSRVLQDEFSSLSWEFVTSSNVESIAYVPAFERLWVRFLSKPGSRYTVYVYFDVDESTWEDLRSAPSKGEWVWNVLRRGGYGYQPVF